MQQIDNQQIQQAAQCGLRILADENTRIPAVWTLNGEVSILQSILRGLMEGQIGLANIAPEVEDDGPEIEDAVD